MIGSWINTRSTVVAELMASAGFDFLAVDAEHSAVGIAEVEEIFRAITSGSNACAPMVRLHGIDYAHVKRYLDAGARGVIAPLVNSAEDAEVIIGACKYPPVGKRGVGFCRANQYGLNLKQAVENANDEIAVMVQIEHVEGVENIDEILSLPEVDGAFLGPYDLSASMGISGQFDHPDFIAARDAVLAACERHQVVPGIHVVQPNAPELLSRVKEGYRFLAYSLDITMLLNASVNGLTSIRQELS